MGAGAGRWIICGSCAADVKGEVCVLDPIREVECVDVHVGGEPLRVVMSGIHVPSCKSGAELLSFAKSELEWLRCMAILEPRGHNDMYGCIIAPPCTGDGHISVLFMHAEGWATMCGHGAIGAVHALAAHGRLDVPDGEDVRIDAPAGRVVARVGRDADGPSVTIDNVRSYVHERGRRVHIDDIGEVSVDITFGGSFFALVSAEELGIDLEPSELRSMIKVGNAIRDRLSEDASICCAYDPLIRGVYGTIICGPVTTTEGVVTSRGAVIQNAAGFDRCACGTGTSARMALLRDQGVLRRGSTFRHFGILGTHFDGEIASEDERGITPRLTSRAYITAYTRLVLSQGDPLPNGFRLI